MSRDSFEFKYFTVRHSDCAMKVGTDGVLLGAWAHGKGRILDIGTGSGVIAMLMAQRFQNSKLTAIDIDSSSCKQAIYNIKSSVFKERINVIETSLQDYREEPFDTIICNPPFFKDSLLCPDIRRSMARHAVTLPFKELFFNVVRLLSDEGEFSVVLPFTLRKAFDDEAAYSGLYPLRACLVSTVVGKQPKRILLSYSKKFVADFEQSSEYLTETEGSRSKWYSDLTKDIYLR